MRVNDPAGKLPAAVGKTSGNALIVQIAGPSGIAQHVPIVSQDAAGRNLAINLPRKEAGQPFLWSVARVEKIVILPNEPKRLLKTQAPASQGTLPT